MAGWHSICTYPSAVTQLIARLPSSYQRALRISGYAAALLSGAAALWLAYRWQLGRSQPHPVIPSAEVEEPLAQPMDTSEPLASEQGLPIVETFTFSIMITPLQSSLYESCGSFKKQYRNYLHVDGSPFTWQEGDFELRCDPVDASLSLPDFVDYSLPLPASLFRQGNRIKQNGEEVSYLLLHQKKQGYANITLIINQMRNISSYRTYSDNPMPFVQAFRRAEEEAQSLGRLAQEPYYLCGENWSLWQPSQSGQLTFVSCNKDDTFDLRQPESIKLVEDDGSWQLTGRSIWIVQVGVPVCQTQDVQLVLNELDLWVLARERLSDREDRKPLTPIKRFMGAGSIAWKRHRWYRHFSVEQMKQQLKNAIVKVRGGQVTMYFTQPNTDSDAA